MSEAFLFSDDFWLESDTQGLSARSRLQERPLSPDQFKTYARCQKKYELQYIRRLNWPSDQRNFELGKNVHKLMEYQARNLPLSHLLKDAPASTQQVWQKLFDHPISHWPIIASEWAFSAPVYLSESHSEEKYWISGRIDRIAWEEAAQTLWVLDWKTGTAAPKKPETDWQTRIYLWAVYRAYQTLQAEYRSLAHVDAGNTQLVSLPEVILPEQIKFMYLEVSVKDSSAPIREIVVPFNQQRLATVCDAIEQQLHKIQNSTLNDTFPLPGACPDAYCPYLNICGIQDVSTASPHKA
ncbi:MAG: PD-(D/E)XK nuclease family protein [Vampirovibrionales bacterium]|nr:PD-(D/E)XK nuclease family protein [Vampirovibrionales bacterium]